MSDVYKTSAITHMGTAMSEDHGKALIESMNENPELKESYSFKEDNDMANSTDLWTTVLAKAIYYKSYDTFQKYFDMVWNLTPADLGQMEGAGVYKLPKILGSTAAKLESGEVVDYVNNNKDSITLETDTYGIGTRINRRLIRRGAKGFIEKLMISASDAVLRAVCTDIINGMVAGASAVGDGAGYLTGKIDYNHIEEAKKAIKESKDANDILFGFQPDTIAFSTVGWYELAISTDYKAFVQYGSRNVPGAKLEGDYMVFNGLKVVQAELITATKNSAVVHAIVFDKNNFAAHLREVDMETFDGRIPGTAGDKEIIHAMDAGNVIRNGEAAIVITA